VLIDLYSSPNIAQVTKSRRMRWAGHVAHTGGGEVHTGFCWVYGTRLLGKPGVDGSIISNRILKEV
jgi:hypothetical protein